MRRKNPEIPRGRQAILCLQCGKRYRNFGRYLEHSSRHEIGISDLEAARITGSPGEGFWWRLRSNRWALVSQTMTVGGEPVAADVERGEAVYTEERGSHVLRVDDVNDTPGVCDVCGSTPIFACYPARRFIGPLGGMVGGPTSLCQACHTLYERGDFTRIFRRVERRLPAMRDRRVRDQIERMLRTLFDNFTGPAVLIGS